PDAVYNAVRQAAELGRSGGGPTLLECVTFRFKGHYAGDPQNYMPAGELAAAEAADPIPRYRRRLIESGVCSEDELDAIERQSTERVNSAVEEVLSAPVPDPDELDKDFYLDMKGIPA